jgi:hypothetical protein
LACSAYSLGQHAASPVERVAEAAERRPHTAPSLSNGCAQTEMNSSESVQVLEMAQWVNSLAPWSVFATHTFSYEASLWSARRVYERFMLKALPKVSYFYAIEANPSRDGHHVHAMWDSLGAPRTATHREWLKRYGRNRIEPVRDFADVVGYCAKYVVRENAWWDFHLSRARRAAVGREISSPLSSGGNLGLCLNAMQPRVLAAGVPEGGV